MAGGFNANTRRKIIPLPTLNKPSGGGTVQTTLPKVGLLARLYLAIRGSVSGTLSNPNPLGFASAVKRVRLTANSGIDIISISGAGYHYLLRDCLDSGYTDPNLGVEARSAVTASNFAADMVLPVAMNLRDPIGLIMLANEQTTLTLTVDFETDSTVATGATVVAWVKPYMEIFTVPVDPADWPPLNVVHQILEEQLPGQSSGDLVYNWPRGNTYLQVLHGYGIGAAGTDAWNKYVMRANQSDIIYSADVYFFNMEHQLFTGRYRQPGVIPVDLMSSSGLGMYGLTRDLFNSALVTDLASVITVTSNQTLFTVRRQLVVLSA